MNTGQSNDWFVVDASDLDYATRRSWLAHSIIQRAKERNGWDWIAASKRGSESGTQGKESTDTSGNLCLHSIQEWHSVISW